MCERIATSAFCELDGVRSAIACTLLFCERVAIARTCSERIATSVMHSAIACTLFERIATSVTHSAIACTFAFERIAASVMMHSAIACTLLSERSVTMPSTIACLISERIAISVAMHSAIACTSCERIATMRSVAMHSATACTFSQRIATNVALHSAIAISHLSTSRDSHDSHLHKPCTYGHRLTWLSSTQTNTEHMSEHAHMHIRTQTHMALIYTNHVIAHSDVTMHKCCGLVHQHVAYLRIFSGMAVLREAAIDMIREVCTQQFAHVRVIE